MGQDAEAPTRRDAQVRPVRDARGVMNDAARPRADMRTPPLDMRLPTTDSAPPQPADMGVINRGNGQYGDRCRCGADCASGLCVPNPYDQFAGECSQVCGPNTDCPGVDSCIQVSMPGPSQNCPRAYRLMKVTSSPCARSTRQASHVTPARTVRSVVPATHHQIPFWPGGRSGCLRRAMHTRH